MQMDPAEERRRLADDYRDMGDNELRGLADDFADLTETAQQALRQEMQGRGLGDPGAGTTAPPTNAPARATTRMEPQIGPGFEFPAGALEPLLSRAPELVPDAPDDSDNSHPHDYSWKTVLCDCDTTEQAQELAAALRQAGLDSWIQGSYEFGRRYARVLVAADQLDRAREIAAQPVPQQVIDESKEETPEFVEPKCPKCGSDDVVLEGVDTRNHWRCESCDAEWSDDAELEDGQTPAPGQTDR
jgi:hypothetical protein